MTTCPYLLGCRNWSCNLDRNFNLCSKYERAENLQVEMAVFIAKRDGYNLGDVPFLAEFFRVPISKLEKALQGKK